MGRAHPRQGRRVRARLLPQEFELCDHIGMLGYMAYSGMPSHYPHWSYGKSYEKLKTLYDHGVSGLPYEMVINSNPALAYLMRDNTLLLQILTIAHVYGHNDFFKNNFTYQLDPRRADDRAVQGPRAARAALRRRTPRSESRRSSASSTPRTRCQLAMPAQPGDSQAQPRRAARARWWKRRIPRPIRSIASMRAPEVHEPDIHKVPLEPDEDLLLFIRDHNPFLAEWEKDLLTIVDEEAKYFLPMIETKIMNEGWASYWHKRIVESLDLDQGLHLEFIVRHNQVVRPIPGQINPYHLGLQNLGGHLSPPHQSDARGDQARRPADQERRRKDLRGARSRARQLLSAPLS